MSKNYYVFLLLLLLQVGFSQNPAEIDFTYDHKDHRPGLGYVGQILVQPNGKILVQNGGINTTGKRIMRLNSDFTLDTSYHENIGNKQSATTYIGQQSDGKILISGDYLEKPDGSPAGSIARLNADGSYDPTFQPPAGLAFINTFRVAPDDGILYRTDNLEAIQKLNANGSQDTSFNQVTTDPWSYFVQPDGKILVPYNGQLKRYNSNGTVDATFQTSTYTCAVKDIKFAESGKFFVSGSFVGGVAKFNADGTPDTSFAPAPTTPCNNIEDFTVQSVQPLPSGKVLIGGYFASYNGLDIKCLVKLNADGSVDNSFPNRFRRGGVSTISTDANGNILLGVSEITDYDGIPVRGYMVLDAQGNFVDPGISDAMSVVKLLKASDGNIIQIASSSTGAYHMGIKVTDQDGNMVTNPNLLKGFDKNHPNNNYDNYIACLDAEIQPDGKIIVAGFFTHYQGVEKNGMVRLNPDYSIDTTFDVGTGFEFESSGGRIIDIGAQPDGKIIVTYLYGTHFNGTPITGYTLRLLSNGQLDTSFNVPSDVGAWPINVLPDDKIMLGAYYRLHPNGDLDTSYELDANAVYPEGGHTTLMLPDGKIQYGAKYRLNADGSIDNSYIGTDIFGSVNTMARQPDGKLIVAGGFMEMDQVPLDDPLNVCILRLNADGTKDETFDPGTGFGANVNALLLFEDGKILAGGDIKRYNGEWNNGTVRLLGGSANVLTGQVRMDIGFDGCDATDPAFPNLKLRATSAAFEMDYIADDDGSYKISLPAGNYTVTPVFENQGYWVADPANFSVVFTDSGTAINQDICITAASVHPDMEVVIVPTSPALPGFISHYTIICKNKGTQVMDAVLTLNHPQETSSYAYAEPAADDAQNGMASWNLSAFNPTEVRTFEVSLHLNTPTDTPSLNSGDILPIEASLTASVADETPADNTFELTQIVVNSFDPNDKTCAEGTNVGVEQIGDYVHYVIRFENTGTYAAQNIRVRDIIDASKYDIGTLVPLGGSSHFTTTITDGNTVDFYLENINLSFQDDQNDGFISFKIKLRNTLEAGDVFSNTASIYFDYNEAIVTNAATTAIEQLSTGDVVLEDDVKMYPNPADGNIQVSCENALVHSVSIYNVSGRLMLSETGVSNFAPISVSGLPYGTYFVKIFTDKGSTVKKLLKN